MQTSDTQVLAKPENTRPYINPYLAGVLLGLVLLASFLVAGRGIGASGFVSQSLAHLNQSLDAGNQYLAEQQAEDSWLSTWIVIEVVGIFLGASLSAFFSGRLRPGVIKSSTQSSRHRLLMALLGGVLMGFAARLARGCTSGQALTGGALLSAGSWLFMLCVFAGAYLTILLVKKNWA